MGTSKYTWEQQLSACMAWCVTGSPTKSEKQTGIPRATIAQWKQSAGWWPEVVQVCRKLISDRFDAQMTGMMDTLLRNIANKIEHGEEIWDHKNGEMVRREVSAKDQTWMFGVLHDKRALGRGDATSISRNSQTEVLDKLEERMERFARTLKSEKVISEQ